MMRGKRRLKWAGAVCAFMMLSVVVLAYVRLRFYPTTETVRAQLGFLRAELDGGSARRMQELFPEGYLFNYVLYGLAWVELAHAEQRWRVEGLHEASNALSMVDSPRGRETFPANQEVPHGVFYSGWTAWLAVKLSGVPGAQRDSLKPRLVALLDPVAEQIGEKVFLEAYPGAVWPCDTVVALAALAEFDRVYGLRYGEVIASWVRAAQAR
ncbi:MAG: hypothetical protein AAFQ82_03095, partial [Myxococcota bacterium]